MTPIAAGEILNLYDYERVRDARRRDVIALKAERRVAVGRYLSFVFENRQTLWFRIQELLRVARLTDAQRVQTELNLYNRFLPGRDQLQAALLLEVGTEAPLAFLAIHHPIGKTSHMPARFPNPGVHDDRAVYPHHGNLLPVRPWRRILHHVPPPGLLDVLL